MPVPKLSGEFAPIPNRALQRAVLHWSEQTWYNESEERTHSSETPGETDLEDRLPRRRAKEDGVREKGSSQWRA
jgi:hypothetical protein